MWIFSRYGHYSIVQNLVDPTRFKVRSRKIEDLEILKRAVPLLRNTPITEDRRADYRYRLFITQEQFIDVMLRLGESVDYTSFKDAIYQDPQQKDRLNSYHKVWETMYDYQQMTHKQAEEMDSSL
jgi:hypothetical protein